MQHTITLAVKMYVTGIGDTVQEALNKAEQSIPHQVRAFVEEPRITGHQIRRLKLEEGD